MNYFRVLGLCCMATSCAFGQATPAAAGDGVLADWDVKSKMEALASDVARIEDLLRRARPHEWVANGAPEAYQRQLESSRSSYQLLIANAEKLARQPDTLSVALETLFRMDSMDLLLTSLSQGIRRYQGASLADDIARFMADNSRHRDMLRQHSVDLAATRENEYKVISAEAQRCRTELSRKDAPESQPRYAPPARSTPSRNTQRRSK